MSDDDKFSRGQYVEGFNRDTSQLSRGGENSHQMPTGRQVYEAGFTTEKSLHYEATIKQMNLRPEPSPDDPEGMENAKKKAREEQSKKYWNYRDTFTAARETFNQKSKDQGRGR